MLPKTIRQEMLAKIPPSFFPGLSPISLLLIATPFQLFRVNVALRACNSPVSRTCITVRESCYALRIREIFPFRSEPAEANTVLVVYLSDPVRGPAMQSPA
jgi:hypothetical protein